ncbi:AsmA family protein [Shimia sp. Alg240-R146]|uniref:AsmA family protein n=1 Tax=Shimia sp. Alg240-R146 TaxID=2993449 RepID=UPI0022E8943A|nr:AsmA family protein [Shimia sp. Alg240-R146]
MKRWIKRTVFGFLLLVLVVVGLGWAALATPIFSDTRKDFVAKLLSEQIGQPFLIDGDVKVVLSGTTLVHVSGASIPSADIPSTNLAELNILEWELDLPALLDRRIDIDNLTIDGLQVRLITKKDGTTSWTNHKTTKPAQETTSSPSTDTDHENVPSGSTAPKPSIFTFLADRTVSFTNIGLLSLDETSGFEFNFQLEKIALDQKEDGNLAVVTGAGTLNGAQFTWDGKYPTGAPFTNQLEFGDITLGYNGEALDDSGYKARLELNTGQIGDVFEALGLVRSLEGVGNLSVDITSKPDLLAFANLQSTLDLQKGQKITIEGDVGNLFTNDAFDISVNARLHPEGQPPAEANSLKEIKVTQINAHIVNEDSQLAFEELLFHTNAFDQGLDRVGPLSIGQIYRSEAQTLGLRDVSIQAGPEDAPYLVAEGDIGDVLNLRLVDMKGHLFGSADLLLKDLPPEDVAAFGGVEADFVIADQDGALSLRHLNARTVNTDLWDLKAELIVASIEELAGLKLGVSFDVLKTKPFLTTLGLQPVGIESLKTGVYLEGTAKDAKVGFEVHANETNLKTDFIFDLNQQVNVVRGKVLSDYMRLDDLREGLKVIRQLSERAKSTKSPKDAEDAGDGKPPIQPLVLEKKGKAFDLQRILTETDLAVAIEIEEFVGDAGTSSMSSELTAKDGQIVAGPLELFYGSGHFKVTASMDAKDKPEIARIQGVTSGWNFGEILKAMDVKIPAHGELSATVDVTGNITSGKAFANSMAGFASLNMRNGGIATSLLELAGLGIFPWLVSKEFSEGETEIVCVKAPVTFSGGQARFNALVAETKSVQLVVDGKVDWVRDAIDIRAEPRRVGKPLARSAWPFDVVGKLSDPRFKLDIGGSRSSRADGADEMPANREPCTPDIEQLQ